MILRTIRFKIVLWYMTLLTITLTLFCFVIYQNYRQTLFDRLDGLLLSRADGIISSINTYWAAEKIEAAQHGRRLDITSKTFAVEFKRVAQSWVENSPEIARLSDVRLPDMSFHVFDKQGRLIVSSKSDLQQQQLPQMILKDVLMDQLYFNTFYTRPAKGSAKYYRQLTLAVTKGTRVAYVIQVSSSLNQLFQDLRSLRRLMFIFLPITVILTGVGGVFLAGLTLRPVNRMIRTIEKITAEDLQTSLDVPRTNDEIQKLAETFNTMLSELDVAFSAQKQFVQDASHELRTPLTILKGEIEVALRKTRTPQQYQETLESSLEEINRLYGIVENLLLMAKMDNTGVMLNKHPVDLGELIQHVAQSIKVLVDQKQIRLVVRTPATPLINGDEQYLKRLILNLLDNAVKYTPDSGEVRIETLHKGANVLLQVANSGPGISEADLPHIFDRFYRADQARTGAGFGLGLSIVKSIVDLHEGTISVKSSTTEGTQVTVSLPTAL